MKTVPEPGQLVRVRARPWVVQAVRPSVPPVPASPFGARQHVVTLTPVEDDALGEALPVIWEIEPGAQRLEPAALPAPTDVDAPDRLDAFLDAVRWGAASPADQRHIQAPFWSGVEIEDYQLDPVVRAVQRPRVSLLITDDVGLGKTIEAGLVALELMLRHRARRILVVCPAALQVQWRDQMRERDERVIITEYRATQHWLHELLAVQGFGGGRLLTMYGGMDADQREWVKAAFQASPQDESGADSPGDRRRFRRFGPAELLLPADPSRDSVESEPFGAAQRACGPAWAKADMVEIFHFVGQGYQEQARRDCLEADLEFLARVARKVETIREDLGKVGAVLAQQVEEATLGRRVTLETTQAEQEAAPLRWMLKFERDLQKPVQALPAQYWETRRELRLSPDNIRHVVEVGLALAGQPPLEPTTTADGQPCFRLPALKGSWAACAEGLEASYMGDIRPITFEKTITKGRDNMVLIHLNHRLTQMCPRLLRVEVWAGEGRAKRNRVTARVVPDDILDTPAVIAHARLVVLGGDGCRLHEEVIAAGGFIHNGRWSGRLTVGQTAAALDGATRREPSAAVKARLLEQYPSLKSDLTAAMDVRRKQLVEGLQTRLAERAEKEVADITSILMELKRAIEAELENPAYIQPMLFTTEEQERFERNRDAMRAHAAEIPEEIQRETAAIQARFANPQAHLFPVAVTFLVPKTMAGGH